MSRQFPFGRATRLFVALCLASVLSACAFDRVTFGERFMSSQQDIEEITPFTHVTTGQAWANPEGIMMVRQRGLLNGSEQQIALANSLPVLGDNLLILRSRNAGLGRGRLQFEELMQRIGGAPAPFEAVKAGDLQLSEDSLGPYLWTQKLIGSDATCVLAIRRLSSDMREMPGEATVLDLVLRNCAMGTADEVLAPILDASVATPIRGGSSAGVTRMLSPLAAPGID